MKSAEGHRCEICAWTLLPGTDLEQHNSGLIHRTLLDAFARLTLDRFEAFLDSVVKGSKRSKFCLKKELRAALEGPRPQSLTLALWEELQPLATRDEDALQMLDEPSCTVVPVQEPADCYGSRNGSHYGDQGGSDRYGDWSGGSDRSRSSGGYGKEGRSENRDRDNGRNGAGGDRYGSGNGGGSSRYEGGSKDRSGPYDRPSGGSRSSHD